MKILKKMYKVLHIDTDHEWRGGQQQGFYLHKKMNEKGCNSKFICQPGSQLEQNCIKDGLSHHPIRIHGELDIFAGKKIAGLCSKEGFNILHLHDAHAMATGLWASLFKPDLKLIGVRRVDFNIKKNIFSRYKYNSKRMTKIIAISNEIKRVMLEDGISEEKIEIIKSGVDINKYSHIEKTDFLSRKYQIPENAFIVGIVAALAGHKDYPTLLKAAEKVISKNKNIFFVALGDGPDKESILKLASELDLKNRFIFTGFQKDVGNHLKNFDVFVLSSHKEGLGTSVMDAMAAGIPCLCCRSGGIPELINHEKTGILVEKRDFQALSREVIKLYNDNDLRSKLAANAKNKSVNFSIDITVKKNIELYEKIIGLPPDSAIC